MCLHLLINSSGAERCPTLEAGRIREFAERSYFCGLLQNWVKDLACARRGELETKGWQCVSLFGSNKKN